MNQKSLRSALVAMLVLCGSTAFAQRGDRLDPSRYRDGKDVKAAFRPLVADANKATVRVRCGGKDAALGTVVGPDGWILTKASELRSPVTCRLADGRELPAKLVGIQAGFDLAMLKIEAKDLPTVEWSKTSDPTVGQFLATASMNDDPLAVGVVSVPRRKIPGRSGVLGISLDESDKGPKITQVFAGSGAEKAGLKAGDIVQKVADQIMKGRETLTENIRGHKPGDTVRLSVLRGEDQLDITATLTLPLPNGGPGSRSEDQNTMGGPLSNRSGDFPLVVQHDTVLRPTDCGGPVCDLSGKVVGVNIARAGRVESYAVPADQITPLLADLMTGKLAPTESLASADEKKADKPKTVEQPAAEEKAKADDKAKLDEKAAPDAKPKADEKKPAEKPKANDKSKPGDKSKNGG